MQRFITFLASPLFGFLLKVLSGLGTAGFGLLGVGAKARDDAGALTGRGKTALIGIVVACVLTVSSVIYDYSEGQRTARDTAEKSQRLLLSVQSGIYPLREMTADIQVRIAGNIFGLDIYEAQLLKNLPKTPRECFGRKDVFCWGADEAAEQYAIPPGSQFYPRPDSVLGAIIANVGVSIAIGDLKSNVKGVPYNGLGSFHFYIKNPTSATVRWYPKEKYFIYEADGVSISDSDVFKSNVYSLVQMFPGFIGANADVQNWDLCTAAHFGAPSQDCMVKILDGLEDGLTISHIDLKFRYPKKISIDQYGAIPCVVPQQTKLVFVFMPNNIEDLNERGEIQNAPKAISSTKSLCVALTDSRFLNFPSPDEQQ